MRTKPFFATVVASLVIGISALAAAVESTDLMLGVVREPGDVAVVSVPGEKTPGAPGAESGSAIADTAGRAAAAVEKTAEQAAAAVGSTADRLAAAVGETTDRAVAAVTGSAERAASEAAKTAERAAASGAAELAGVPPVAAEAGTDLDRAIAEALPISAGTRARQLGLALLTTLVLAAIVYWLLKDTSPEHTISRGPGTDTVNRSHKTPRTHDTRVIPGT